MEPTNRPGNRNLTREDLPGILAALGVIAAFIILAALGHPIAGATVLGGAMCIAFLKMPREQREVIGQEIERRERTPTGRVLKVVEVLGGLLLLYILAQAALSRW